MSGSPELLHIWRNPSCLGVSVFYFEFFSTKFAACLKPPSRNNDCKLFNLRMQQHEQGACGTQIMRLWSLYKRCFLPFSAKLPTQNIAWLEENSPLIAVSRRVRNILFFRSQVADQQKGGSS